MTPLLEAMTPIAHLAHGLWVLYLIPVLIVLVGILLSARATRQTEREAGSAPGSDSRD